MTISLPRRTLIFCTSFVSRTDAPIDAWTTRYRVWVDAVRHSSLQFDQILIVDDASEKMPLWNDALIIDEDQKTNVSTTDLVVYRFKKHLGRRAVSDFPGWVRSFFFASIYADIYGFDKIIHIESDAFLISRSVQEYVNSLKDGWTTFWCPRWDRAESAIQIIAGSTQLEKFRSFAKQDIEALAGAVIETTLPFTTIEKQFIGDRYNEFRDNIPKDADWCTQAGISSGIEALTFYWWLPKNVTSRAMAAQKILIAYQQGIENEMNEPRIFSKLSSNFTNNGQNLSSKPINWSLPEDHGSWTLGNESQLELSLPTGDAPYKLSLALLPFISKGTVESQRLRLIIGNEILADLVINDRQLIHSVIPEHATKDKSNVILQLWHPDAISPMAVGISNDVRSLGFLVQSVEVIASSGDPTQENLPPGESAPIETTFEIVTKGNLANRMIQYMVALTLKSKVTDCRITNVHLPEWKIDISSAEARGRIFNERQEQHIDIDKISKDIQSGLINRVNYFGFGQRMENFLDVDFYRSIFVAQSAPIRNFGSDVIVINVRAGDILEAIHPFYTIIPVQFYVDVVKFTGLTPVFMGQTDPNPYTDNLRRHFPHAEFLPSGGAMADFEIIRNAKNIIISVSTFSWLAAWLSNADQIHVPVNGLLNPMQESRVDLLPLNDTRYRFYLFPINRAVPSDKIFATHAAMNGQWRLVSPSMIRTMRSEQPRFKRQLRDYIDLFDANYYLKIWPEFKKLVESGGFSSALDHYIRVGFAANLEAFPLDREWYAREYPIAALEVSQGDFIDLEHQFAAVGNLRDAKPNPPTHMEF